MFKSKYSSRVYTTTSWPDAWRSHSWIYSAVWILSASELNATDRSSAGNTVVQCKLLTAKCCTISVSRQLHITSASYLLHAVTEGSCYLPGKWDTRICGFDSECIKTSTHFPLLSQRKRKTKTICCISSGEVLLIFKMTFSSPSKKVFQKHPQIY